MKSTFEKIINRFERQYIPLYSVIPIIGMLLINVLTYNGNRLITEGMTHYSVSTAIDNIIPFNVHFVHIYIFGAYVQWICGFIMVAREKKKIVYRLFAAEIIAKLITMVIFFAFPTEMARPEIAGSGISAYFTRWLYTADAANNLFPSVHCLESWFLFRASFSMKKIGKPYKIIMLVTTLLVFASTVFLKQHEFVDILGGMAVVEIGFIVAKKTDAGRIFEVIRKRIKKKLCSLKRD